MAVSESSSSASPLAHSWRRLRWVAWVAVAVVAVLAVLLILNLAHHAPAVATSSDGVSSVTPPPLSWAPGKRRAPGFSLIDQHGRPVSLNAYRGRPVIVTFVDPLCRNYCPLEAKQLNELVRAVPTRQRPAVLAVSVNVYGNARKNLLADVAKWRLVPQWRWAVGRPRQLASVWHRYQIGVAVTTKRIAGVTVHEISHTDAAYLIDGRGYERALFLWPFRAGDVQAALAKLSSAS